MDYLSFAIICEELERGRHGIPGRPERPRRAELADPDAVGDRRAEAALARCPRLVARSWRRSRLTEPGVGTDAANLATTARRDGDTYVLNGQKIWISLADSPTTSWSSPRSTGPGSTRGVTAFLLERGMTGLTTGTLHGKLGIRAGNTGIINMDDVRVPVETPDRRGGRGLPHRDERHRPGPLHRGRRATSGWPRPASTRRSSTPTSARRSARRSAGTSS